MDYSIAEKPQTLIVGIACRTSNAPEAAPVDIPELWARFYGEDILSRIENKASDEVFALYCDYEGDFTKPYSLVIGCPVKSIGKLADGLVAKTIPGGSYALFKAVGEHPKALIDTWGAIWQTGLKRSYTGDFEVYGRGFSNTPPEVNVWIAIE